MAWPGKYLRIVLALLVTLLCAFLLAQLRDFIHDVWIVMKVLVIPFLLALVVTYLLQPVVDLLVARRVPRSVAILVIYAAFLLLVVIGIINAIPIVSKQMNQLFLHLPQLLTQTDHWIDGFSRRKEYLPDAVRQGFESALQQAEKNVSNTAAAMVSMLTGTLNVVFVVLTVPFLVFYMLKDARAIGRAAVRLAPAQHRDKFHEVLTGIDDTLGRYVRGQLLVMLSVGVLTYAGYLIIRMPYAFLLALFLAAADLIPYLGPFIGAAPALILGLAISPQMGLKVLVVNLIVQQCEGNLISPQIMGKSLELHPMAIVAVLLIGGEVGGFLGLMVAVPLLAVAKVVWHHARTWQSE